MGLFNLKGNSVGNFLVNWYIANRNWRAVFTAFFLSLLLIWALIEKRHNDTHPLESKETMTATVLSVEKKGGTDPQYDRYQCKIEFEDKTAAEIIIKMPVPVVGDKVSVIVERYKGGDVRYSYQNPPAWDQN